MPASDVDLTTLSPEKLSVKLTSLTHYKLKKKIAALE